MPILPSRLCVGISTAHIMEPDLNWFKAPEGHFWYWKREGEPPYEAGATYESSPATAPIPSNKEEAKKYVNVLVGKKYENMHWLGDTLYNFPLHSHLSDDDLAAWKEWANSKEIEVYLDEFIERCRTQSEVNKSASGLPIFQGVEKGEHNEKEKIKVVKVINNPNTD